MRIKIIALMSCAAVLAPVAVAHAQNPLSSIFSCQNSNNSQGKGAVVGGLLGGLLGNQINDNDRTTGTVLGAALGAAAGSYVGCNMTNADTTRAEEATRQALNENRSQTWSNSQSGVSGRIDIVDTFPLNNVSDRVSDPYRDGRNPRRPTSLADVRFAPGVQEPRDYGMTDGRFETRSRVNIRSSPSARGRVMGQLRSGEEFDALARVGGGGGWLLVGRNGEAIGYVSEDVVSPAGFGDTYAMNRGANNNRVASGQVCRVFDQTIQRRGAAPTTQRFTACQTTRPGDWVMQS